MSGKEWIDCSCGESIAVSGSAFGQAVLAEWREAHADHQSTDQESDR